MRSINTLAGQFLFGIRDKFVIYLVFSFFGCLVVAVNSGIGNPKNAEVKSSSFVFHTVRFYIVATVGVDPT